MSRKTIAVSSIVATVVLILSSCASSVSTLRPADPRIVQNVTQGPISRHDPIRVTFTHEVPGAEAGKRLTRNPLRLSPAVAGTAVWADERTLEFTPSKPLAAGTRFTATMDVRAAGVDIATAVAEASEAAGAPDVDAVKADARLPQNPDPVFTFSFSVRRPDFDVALQDLSVDSNGASYRLEGTVETADREDPARVENMIAASLAGRRLATEWTHDEGRMRHLFRVTGIDRGAEASRLEVSWSGKPIGNAVSGSRALAVPAKGSFEVLGVKAVDDGETQCIEVGFSDALDPAQDLRGLVRVEGREELRFAVARNRLRVYGLSPWGSEESITVEPGVRSKDGQALVVPVQARTGIGNSLPQVRFAGTGTIVPTTQGLTVPIETMNLRAVIVEAFRVYGNNVTQFLQVNDLSDSREMYRVGSVAWRRVVNLPYTEDQHNAWVRHGLDLTRLVKDNPGGMFQLRISFRAPHVVWRCAEPDEPVDYSRTPLVEDQPAADGGESSYWDYWEPQNQQDYYQNRQNPCHPAFYQPGVNSNVLAIRNVLISDIGLMAKAEPSGLLYVFASDLRTAQPMAGVKITAQSFQRIVVGSVTTDASGMASLRASETPAFLVAEAGGQSGYLKVTEGSALAVSHLDVAGAKPREGVRGFLYGERGVWRPGDPIHLTFVLHDPQDVLPDDHPVTLELRDPRGQVAQRFTKTASVDGFYSFPLSTDPEAPTGSWEARVKVGDRTFSKSLRIETVMPNRLKIDFDVPARPGGLAVGRISGVLSSLWLHGAIASGLKADLKVQLASVPTVFERWTDYVFDDPSRVFSPEQATLFEGDLDREGRARIEADLTAQGTAPGKLQALFAARVFESSGAFSSEQFAREFNPYPRYVGVQVPKGDAVRGMLLTDTDQTVKIALVDGAGVPLSGQVRAEIVKINWRWWWEKGEEDLASFVSGQSLTPIKQDTLRVVNGRTEWKFQVKYPDWGRYLIRVKDLQGGHSTGKVIYIDWPGWAGRATADKGGASMLTLTADKPKYDVGEKVSVTFPSNAKGRALVVVEAAGRVARKEWVTPTEGTTRYTFEATADMAPNAYVHVTFLQPHLQTANDLPIRLYGILPVLVEDPATRLRPVVRSADAFSPGKRTEITVSEAEGREMTYTLAVVDEGLLRINRFSAPDPWNSFYTRLAALLRSWDLYDSVAGAFAGKLENLLAIGGSEDELARGDRKANRFEPVVRFFGPVTVKKGQSNVHVLDMPQYVGAVRLMVVAGHAGAYGVTEKEVPVKSDLMVLATLPRTFSVDEEADLPVSVFTATDTIQAAAVRVSVTGPVSVTGSPTQVLAFDKPDEKMAHFRLKVGSATGTARVTVIAEGGGARAEQTVEIAVRYPGTAETRTASAVVDAGRSWSEEVTLPGYPGTNTATLEVSRVPPLDLGRNLAYLIQYPHGCVEQTTSSVFPQLGLEKLVKLSGPKAAEVQKNIEAGIDRLRLFQTSTGGFAYWPGQPAADDWATTYAGHFLVEARARGFALPQNMIEQWASYQKARAQAWRHENEEDDMRQAYRLYTLALAGQADAASMNRMRESKDLAPTVLWRLAAAYKLAGREDEARRMTAGLSTTVDQYAETGGNFGSDLRDRAMILETLVILGRMQEAEALARGISQDLARGADRGTQTTAYALIALSRFAVLSAGSNPITVSYSWAGEAEKQAGFATPMFQEELAVPSGQKAVLRVTNNGNVTVYPRLILRGIPRLGTETAQSNGLELEVLYQDDTGMDVDPQSAQPGQDLTALVTVTNTSRYLALEQLALNLMVPDGWEIGGRRLTGEGDGGERGYDYQDIRDDRVYTYFGLAGGESRIFAFPVTPAYGGTFYLPAVSVEAMYDPSINARVPGRWLGDK